MAPQQSDILLAGAGYMIVPGSYMRSTDAEPETRPGRWTQHDFAGGQRQAFAQVRERGWDSVGVGPALNGQGVEPWPYIETYTDGGLSGRPVDKSKRLASVVAGSRSYYGHDRYWYGSSPLGTGSWSGFNQYLDGGVGKTVSDASPYQDKIAICWGTGRDIDIFDPATNTAAALSAGERGYACVGYAGRLLFGDDGNRHELRMTTGGAIDTRLLDSPIIRMGIHGGAAVIATRTSLYRLTGKSDSATGKWIGEPEPLFSHGAYVGDQDFHFLLSFGGKLYTWLANQVMEYNPSAGSSRQGWRAIGLDGRSCNGAIVAGDKLIVTVTNRQGTSQVWAWDGSAWWLSNERSTQWHCWPIYLAGAADFDCCVFRDGSSSITYDLFRLVYRDLTIHNYRSSGAWRSSLLDGGDPAGMKSWQAIGCSFETPEIRGNGSSTDAVDVTLTYSVDNGKTFSTHLTANVNDPTDQLLRLEGAIAGGAVESNSLQIRVLWGSVSDWAPTLASVWAVYEVMQVDPKQRRWKMDIICRDGAVLRDGAVDPRSGRQIAADLWAAWAINATLTLRDLDYAITAVQYGVRILSIVEKVKEPKDAERWGDSILSLTLAQV